MMRRLLVCLVAGLVLSGCATNGNHAANERYDKMMSSFLGVTESTLIDSWGPPDRVYETEDSKFLTYTSSRTVPVPAPMPIGARAPFPMMYGGSASLSCKNTFKIRNGIVVSVRFQGNACRA